MSDFKPSPSDIVVTVRTRCIDLPSSERIAEFEWRIDRETWQRMMPGAREARLKAFALQVDNLIAAAEDDAEATRRRLDDNAAG